MMPVIKHFDPVMGVDIHIVVLPPGVPTPIPHPHIAMIIDPMDYVPVLGATVFIGPLPRASAGTAGKPIPHIPMGGPFVKPPMNEDEIFMGSAMVLADGDPLSYTALPVLSCQDVGMISPPRKKPKRSYGMVLPLSIVMGIPLGMPVLVGGPPTINMMALGMAAVMKALGPALKKLRALQKKSTRIKKISDAIHTRANKLLDKLGVPPNARNKVHKSICTVTGHPVDVASGKLLTDFVDFQLPGPIPLIWERTWYSTSVYDGPLGRGWHHAYDMELIAGDRTVAVRLVDGRGLAFPPLGVGEECFHRGEQLSLFRDSYGYAMDSSEGLRYRFVLLDEDEGRHKISTITQKSSGAQIQFDYDSHQVLRHIIDSGGRHIYFEYYPDGLLHQIWLPEPAAQLGGDTHFCALTYHYQHGDLTGVEDALGQLLHYRYHNHILAEETWRNGLSFHFTFDAWDHTGKCIRTWGDDNLFWRDIEYSDSGDYTRVTDSLGYVVHYYHDGVVPQRVIDAIGAERYYRYNEFYELIEEIHPDGQIIRQSYDDRGNLVEAALNGQVRFKSSYNALDLPNFVQDGNGNQWIYDYNPLGILLRKTSPEGLVYEYEYQRGLLAKVTAPSGNVIQIHYDQQKNPTRILINQFLDRATDYDALGNAIALVDAHSNRTEIQHDLLQRPVVIHLPDGNSRQLEYDANSNITRVIEKGRDVQLGYGGFDRVLWRAEAGTRLQFLYDTEDQLREIVNENNERYRFEYDGVGNLIRETGFDGVMREFELDLAGRILRVRRPAGRFTDCRYDRFGRLTRVGHSDGSHVSYAYRDDGALLEANNGLVHIRRELDSLGRVLKEWQNQHWVSFHYDLMGQLQGYQSSLGAQQSVTRNSRGDILKIQSSDQLFAATFERDTQGLELRKSLPGGVATRWKRDKLGRPVELALAQQTQETTLLRYQWGHRDRLLLKTGVSGEITHYHHDALGRLIAATYEDGGEELRLADRVGNLYGDRAGKNRRYSAAGAILEDRSEASGKTTHYRYDDEGFLVDKEESPGQRWRYEWDGAGNLKRVNFPNGDWVKFGYDPFGRRVSKVTPQKATYWIWVGDVPLHEWSSVSLDPPADASNTRDASPAIQARKQALKRRHDHAPAPPAELPVSERQSLITWHFEPGRLAPLAKQVGDAVFSIVCDHLDTPIRAFDSQGGVVWSAELNMCGGVRRHSGDVEFIPFRFPGQYHDVETGLYYNRFRYYAPESGAYISQDPIKLLGAQNLYGYVDNPNSEFDFLGLAKSSTSYSSGFKPGFGRSRVVATPQGRRAKPSVYLRDDYIKDHLSKFRKGATFLTPTANLDRFGRNKLGRPDGVFVMPTSEVDALMRRTGGDIAKIEKELGIPPGSWTSGTLSRIDVADPKALNLRMPSGNEAGANDLWIPGGKLPTGFSEAVVDQIPIGRYTETIIP